LLVNIITKIKINNFYLVLHDQILIGILNQLTKMIFVQHKYSGGGICPPPPTTIYMILVKQCFVFMGSPYQSFKTSSTTAFFCTSFFINFLAYSSLYYFMFYFSYSVWYSISIRIPNCLLLCVLFSQRLGPRVVTCKVWH
jgi:hypothetical protein